MIKNLVINKYLSNEFTKVVFKTTLTFFFLGFVMNLFEEINFFKDIDGGVYLPLLLTSILVPSLLYNMLPFIILISGILFFLKIKKTDEITALKVSGMSNFSIIIIPGVVSVVIGILFITLFNPITSVLVEKYEIIKGSYDRDKQYLASITQNGIWIREKNETKSNIIRSSNLKNESLMDITIYEFDRKNNFIKRIQANSANIRTISWLLENVSITDVDGNKILTNENNYIYKSIYDLNKLKSLYSNLDTVSFWRIGNEIKLLKERGYSTKEMETKLQKSFAFPFFLLSMVFLSGVFILGLTFKENNLTYIFITIITCVLVYFFNDFSAALGKTEKLGVEIAVWMPILIIFIFGSVGLIYANQK